MKHYTYTLLVLLCISCIGTNPPDAAQIIDQTIALSGGERYVRAAIDFDFRDYHYMSTRQGGTYQYERIFTDSTGTVRDVLGNEGFARYINDTVQHISDTMATKYSNSVNSVFYFALLPYGLNDDAVQKSYIGESTIKGKAYHKIKVTFKEEGGGEDFQDVFVYWISKDRNTMDYLAYSYHTDGGGSRFRQAYNISYVEGVRFADYINYKYEGSEYNLEDYDKAFEANQLKKLSVIELKNIEVKLL